MASSINEPAEDMIQQPQSRGALWSFGQYLTEPREFFSELAKRPRWLVVYSVMVVLAIATNLMLGPLVSRLTLQSFMPMPSADKVEAMQHSMLIARYLGVVILPISQLCQLMAVAFMTWIAACAVSVMLPFRTILSLVTYAWIPNVLDRAFGAASNYLAGYADNVSSVSELRTLSPSLADIIHSDNSFVTALLHQGTMFYLWSIILLIIGLTAADSKGRRNAAALAVLGSQALIVLSSGALQSIAQSFRQ
jgi:hypothetical protein